MKPYNCSGDLLNLYRMLEKSLKKNLIIIRDFEPNLSNGDGVICCKILSILLLQTCREITISMLKKGVNSTSGDRRIVLSTFDILRENNLLSPSISADQFMGKHFIEHKFIILHKLSEYIYSIKQKPKESNLSRKNSPSYQESIDGYNNLDDEEWVHKYVITHPNNINMSNSSNSNSNSNSNGNTDDDIIPLSLHHLDDVPNKSFTNSNNNDNNINNNNYITISESDLKRIIEVEVNKKIIFHHEKQALIIEQFRKSYESKLKNLEQRLQNVEEGIIETKY